MKFPSFTSIFFFFEKQTVDCQNVSKEAITVGKSVDKKCHESLQNAKIIDIV